MEEAARLLGDACRERLGEPAVSAAAEEALRTYEFTAEVRSAGDTVARDAEGNRVVLPQPAREPGPHACVALRSGPVYLALSAAPTSESWRCRSRGRRDRRSGGRASGSTRWE